MKTLKYLIFLLFVLLFAYDAYSQNVIHKPTTTQKPNTNTQTSTANKFILKISPNVKSQIKVDGEYRGDVEAGGIKKVYLQKGEFKIEVISIENKKDVYTVRYTVKEEDLNTEKLYDADVLTIRNARIAREQIFEAQQAVIRKAKADSVAKEQAIQKAKQEAIRKAKADAIAKEQAIQEAKQQAIIREAKADSIAKVEFLALLNGISTNMIFVQGGIFTMGCTSEQGSDCEDDEKPSHSVTLSNFYIGKYEVTQKQWKAVMGNNPSKFTGCDDCPVENVSWNDVQEFITKLNQLTGKVYRLPTEAEWEYAARGGNISKGYKFSGSNNIDYVAWYYVNSSSKTHSVGQKQPNELGIYDMSGNVWEWCSDWYKGYPNSTEVFNYTNQARVVRGGCWFSRDCRSSCRSSSFTGRIGFRLVFSK